MLEYSKLCENDDEENKYLNKAAEAGNTEEAVRAFTRQITEEAISFFQQSSNIEDLEGHYQLAHCYLNRTSVKQDQKKAKE